MQYFYKAELYHLLGNIYYHDGHWTGYRAKHEVLSLHAVCILQMPETALLQEEKKNSGQTCELTTFLNSVYCFFCSFPLICFSIDLFVDFFF